MHNDQKQKEASPYEYILGRIFELRYEADTEVQPQIGYSLHHVGTSGQQMQLAQDSVTLAQVL